MPENIKISVIMPVYKVEDYVAKAIESIQRQTLQEIEILIVDDGSPDKSGEICDRYAAADSRIKVLHKKNGGAPSARNTAIDISRGKYLYFIDSDDWAEPAMLEDMYTLAEKNNSQLIIAGFYIDTYYSDKHYTTTDYIPSEAIYTSKQEFRKNAYRLFDKNMLYVPWNKLYLSEYLKDNHLYFPNTFWDDFPFNLSMIKDVERVAVTSSQYYHFLRARAESETAKYVPQMYEKREEEHRWMTELYSYWKIWDDASLEMISRRYIDRLIGCMENLTNPNCTLSRKEIQKEVKRIISTENTRSCLKSAVPKSLYLKLLYLSIQLTNAPLLLLEAKLITYIKTKNVKLFTILKTNR